MEATEVRKLATLEDRHWWYAERRAVLRRMVGASGVLTLAGSESPFALDIGAAGGGNTRVLRDLGFFAVPIEYGHEGAEVARERSLPVLRADARRLPVATASAGLVVAFDVLEHIEEDEVALSEISRVLQPGGHLLVAVPADMGLWSAHDEAVGHVRRYTKDTLAEVVRTAGFEVDSLTSWNVLLRPAVAMRRRTSAGSDLGEIGPGLNRALRGVIAVERLLPVWGRMRGVSLLLRARRRR
jgi:SAM-dependent methyltransferase